MVTKEDVYEPLICTKYLLCDIHHSGARSTHKSKFLNSRCLCTNGGATAKAKRKFQIVTAKKKLKQHNYLEKGAGNASGCTQQQGDRTDLSEDVLSQLRSQWWEKTREKGVPGRGASEWEGPKAGMSSHVPGSPGSPGRLRWERKRQRCRKQIM